MKLFFSLFAVVSGSIAGLTLEVPIYKEMFFAISILGVFCAFACLNQGATDENRIES